MTEYTSAEIKTWLGISTGDETIEKLVGKQIYVKLNGSEYIATFVK